MSQHQLTGSGRSSPSIAGRLAAGLLCLNGVVILIALLGLDQSRHRHEQSAVTAAKNLALVLDRELSATIEKIDLLLLTVADEKLRVGTLADARPATLDRFIERQGWRVPELTGLSTADACGEVEQGPEPVKGARGNLGDRAFFKQLAGFRGAGLVVSEPLRSDADGEWNIVLGRRLERSDGVFDGVVLATLPLRFFGDKFAALDVGRRGVVALRRTDLSLIARYPVLQSIGDDVSKKAVSAPLRSQVPAGQSADAYTAVSSADGVSRTVSFRRLGSLPMVVIVGIANRRLPRRMVDRSNHPRDPGRRLPRVLAALCGAGAKGLEAARSRRRGTRRSGAEVPCLTRVVARRVGDCRRPARHRRHQPQSRADLRPRSRIADRPTHRAHDAAALQPDLSALVVPEAVVEGLDRLAAGLAGPLAGELEEYLTVAEVGVLTRRVTRLRRRPEYPSTPRNRTPIPWPPL